MLAGGISTSSRVRWLRALVDFVPGAALVLGAMLASGPTSAEATGETHVDAVAMTVETVESLALTGTAEPSWLDESLALASDPEPLADELRNELVRNEPAPSEVPPSEVAPSEVAPSEDSDLLPARAVGMCGDHAQSIEAPPPIYPGSGGAVRGCASASERVEKLDSLPPIERLALDSAPAFRTAILAEPLRVLPATRVRIDFPPFERFVTEEHRVREPRPPRG